MFGLTKEEIKRMREKFIGKKVQVVINDPWRYFEGTGIVERVDDMGTIWGTWTNKNGERCSLGVAYGEDTARIIEG